MDSHVLLTVITSIKVKGFESVEAADLVYATPHVLQQTEFLCSPFICARSYVS